ncbi:MAG TPA: helix-turn-helix domain-containing protein [Candidatus Nanopelagicales bacterium]
MTDQAIDPRRHRVLAGASRAAVLDVLRRSPTPLGVAAVAGAVGLHTNTVRSHLDLLVESGHVVRGFAPRTRPGRPAAVYEATAAPDDGRNYQLLAEVLAGYLISTSARPAEAAAAAGRQWAGTGSRTTDGGPVPSPPPGDGVAQVLRMLADTGFAPELTPDGRSIRLHHCPFRELAQAYPQVVCSAHLGIMQGALAELGVPVEATRLLPFVEDDLCVASLSPTD